MVLGLRSYTWSDRISYQHTNWELGVKGFAPGGLVLFFTPGDGYEKGIVNYHRRLKDSEWYEPYPANHVGKFGFIGDFTDFKIFFPAWCSWLVSGIAPTFWIWRRVRSRCRPSGLCGYCGYSLTGNTSGVCPECGTPVPKEPADKSPRPA